MTVTAQASGSCGRSPGSYSRQTRSPLTACFLFRAGRAQQLVVLRPVGPRGAGPSPVAGQFLAGLLGAGEGDGHAERLVPWDGPAPGAGGGDPLPGATAGFPGAAGPRAAQRHGDGDGGTVAACSCRSSGAAAVEDGGDHVVDVGAGRFGALGDEVVGQVQEVLDRSGGASNRVSPPGSPARCTRSSGRRGPTRPGCPRRWRGR